MRALDAPAEVEPHVPTHTACSDCHSREDYLDASRSEPLCATCHPNAILDVALKTQVLPFPKRLNQFGIVAFLHRTHMDPQKMTEHPDRYGCEFCHSGGSGVTAKNFPGHAQCYSCHIHQAGQRLGRCQDCHALTAASLSFLTTEGVSARDYHFLHSGHTKNKDGTAIPCATCHGFVAAVPKGSDIARLEPARGLRHTSMCWGSCHKQKEETNCQKCHVSGVPVRLRTS